MIRKCNLSIYIVMTAVISTLSLSGCGKDKAAESSTVYSSETLAADYSVDPDAPFDPDHEFDDITDAQLAAVPTLDENLTEEQFLAMDTNQFRAFVKKYVPGYRESYNVESDKAFTEDDWNSLKALMCYRLFGDLKYTNTTVSGNSASTETETAEETESSSSTESNPMLISDLGLSEDEINDMEDTLKSASDDEMREIIHYLFTPDNTSETEDATVASDISRLTSEEIESCRKELIQECEDAKAKLQTTSTTSAKSSVSSETVTSEK